MAASEVNCFATSPIFAESSTGTQQNETVRISTEEPPAVRVTASQSSPHPDPHERISVLGLDTGTESFEGEVTTLLEHSRLHREVGMTPTETIPQPRDRSPQRTLSPYLSQPSPPQAVSSPASSSVSSFSLRPTSPALYEYTDLDLLLARLESPTVADDLPGSTYDDLVTLSSLIGPAVDPSSNADNVRALEELPVAFVEIERRRVLKDGRVKLKLSLMGVAVDRCGVCLTQFKKKEQGVILPCRHAFHPKCVYSWLLQHMTCPLCRASMIESSS